MASKKKLEEEIAKTKDPVIQKQLQDLLEQRKNKLQEFFGTSKQWKIIAIIIAFFCILYVLIFWGFILASIKGTL